MRKSTLFLIYISLNMASIALMFTHAGFRKNADLGVLKDKTDMVKKLQLTDICLFTEAGYTRHLSQADLHTPFQDSPTSLEHFPSGALAGPPDSLRKLNGQMD
jgi:hypothetical protein